MVNTVIKCCRISNRRNLLPPDGVAPMKNEILTYRQKLSNFNQWKNELNRSRSVDQKLQEFLILFNLANYLDKSDIKKWQKNHLNNLIAIQKRLNKSS